MSALAIVDAGAATHTGNVRRTNEDSHLLAPPLFMVADGVGGARAGELASRMCAEAFAAADLDSGAGEQVLREAARAANRAIHERARTDGEAAGMGTTVVAALFDGRAGAAFAHVGDSRIYLLREGLLQRLSEDHSLVSELVQSGRLTEAEAERHPQRNVVTRVLGTEPDVVVDTFTIDLRASDLVLLCSDGLNTMVAETRIAELLAAEGTAQTAARRLVQAARQGGGEDNVTAVVFRVGSPVADRAAGGAEPAAEPQPPPPQRRRLGGRIRLAAAGVCLTGLVCAGVVGWLASNFVGADPATGRVAIYRGLPFDLPLGIHLYQLRYESPVAYALLPPARRVRLFDQRLRSSSGAYALLAALEREYP